MSSNEIAFVERLKAQVQDGLGLEVWTKDPDVGHNTRRFSLNQRYFVVPRKDVEIDWFREDIEIEIDFPEALVLVTASFAVEDGNELITVELTLEEVLEVWD